MAEFGKKQMVELSNVCWWLSWVDLDVGCAG